MKNCELFEEINEYTEWDDEELSIIEGILEHELEVESRLKEMNSGKIDDKIKVFDHNLAQELYKNGTKIPRIAKLLGVTEESIRGVINEDKIYE